MQVQKIGRDQRKEDTKKKGPWVEKALGQWGRKQNQEISVFIYSPKWERQENMFFKNG